MKKLALATAVIAALAANAFAAEDSMKKEAMPSTANPSSAPVVKSESPSAADKLSTKEPSAGKVAYKLDDGKTTVEVQNGTGWVNGKPAPKGVWHSADGKTITIGDAGKVESVK